MSRSPCLSWQRQRSPPPAVRASQPGQDPRPQSVGAPRSRLAPGPPRRRRRLAGIQPERCPDRRRGRRAGPGKLVTAWTAGLDGAVYGQPLVIGGDVIAATENDSIYALSRTTGRVVWQTHVGTPVAAGRPARVRQHLPARDHRHPCLRPGQRPGVRGSRGHRLPARAGRGRRRPPGRSGCAAHSTQPTASNQPAYNQQRPALAIDDGRVYATFGGLAGDCGPYRGGVVSAPLAGKRPAGPLAGPDQPRGRHLGDRRAGRRALTATYGCRPATAQPAPATVTTAATRSPS